MAYNTPTDLSDYATARGYTLKADLDVLLLKAHDYLETLLYKGEKTEEEQESEFPRKYLWVGEKVYPADEVPKNIKTAELVLAIEIDKGFDPFAWITPTIIRERVEGAIDTEYSSNNSSVSSTRITSIAPLLRGFTLSSGQGLRIASA